jgi:hypothetical protein
VNGAFNRATRPPSWSTLTHRGSRAQGDRLETQLGDLLRLLDVAREQDDAAKPELTRQGLQLDRQLRAIEPRDQQSPDLTAE